MLMGNETQTRLRKLSAGIAMGLVLIFVGRYAAAAPVLAETPEEVSRWLHRSEKGDS